MNRIQYSDMAACTVLSCPAQFSRLTAEAKLFHSLSDPTRLAILKSLVSGPLRVVDLCRLTGRAQPNLSSHLACLRDCGLVIGQPNGRETYYSIAEPEMIAALVATEKVVTKIGHQICGCPLLPMLEQ